MKRKVIKNQRKAKRKDKKSRLDFVCSMCGQVKRSKFLIVMYYLLKVIYTFKKI